MTNVLLATPQPDVRAALRLLLLDLELVVVGEAADWPTALSLAPVTRPNLLLVDWELIAKDSGNTLSQLRAVCPTAVVIVLISQLDSRQQAAVSAGADAFISKGEMPDRVAERLRMAADQIHSQ
jgi:DNA-binding NarL/FixJ family response regulator